MRPTDSPGGLSRAQVAVTVAGWAAADGRPLFVGNGLLLREVAARADADSTFYLFGGMGLAAAVAAGFIAGAGECARRAAVLEGDGNFAMGLAGSIACASAPGNIVHVVFGNGVYESTGGQAVPWSPRDPSSIANELGYCCSYVVGDTTALERALIAASRARGASLVWVEGRAGGETAPRPALDPGRCAVRFQLWYAQIASKDLS